LAAIILAELFTDDAIDTISGLFNFDGEQSPRLFQRLRFLETNKFVLVSLLFGSVFFFKLMQSLSEGVYLDINCRSIVLKLVDNFSSLP